MDFYESDLILIEKIVKSLCRSGCICDIVIKSKRRCSAPPCLNKSLQGLYPNLPQSASMRFLEAFWSDDDPLLR